MDAWNRFFSLEVQTPPTLMSLATIGGINLLLPLFALNHRDIELLPLLHTYRGIVHYID